MEFFHVEMASRADTALDQLNHIIDATFSSIEKFESLYYIAIVVYGASSSTGKWVDGSTGI